MTRRTTALALALSVGVLSVLVSLTACAGESRQYIVGGREQKQQLRRLRAEIEQHGLRNLQGLTALELFTEQLVESGHPELMHRLLIRSVLSDPENPYNAVILFLLANYYTDSEQLQLAAYYYRNIINNYSDVQYDNESIHLRSLINLTEFSTDANKLADYHRMLIYRFPSHIDTFINYRSMIEQYRRSARWELLFQTYRELIDFCEENTSACQNDADRVEYIDNARARVRFFGADRYWTAADLDTVVSEVKQALLTQSATALLNWQAGVNFFARSWEQEEFDFNSQINFNIGIFLRRSRVNFARELDNSSNAQEAYLRTWGWSHRIPTWYFYFRKIDFPADPEVHGNWEWAGIFFGELL